MAAPAGSGRNARSSVDVGDDDAVRDRGQARIAGDLELGRVDRGDTVACRREHPSLETDFRLPARRQSADRSDEGQVTSCGGLCVERRRLLAELIGHEDVRSVRCPLEVERGAEQSSAVVPMIVCRPVAGSTVSTSKGASEPAKH